MGPISFDLGLASDRDPNPRLFLAQDWFYESLQYMRIKFVVQIYTWSIPTFRIQQEYVGCFGVIMCCDFFFVRVFFSCMYPECSHRLQSQEKQLEFDFNSMHLTSYMIYNSFFSLQENITRNEEFICKRETINLIRSGGKKRKWGSIDLYFFQLFFILCMINLE